MARVRRRHQPYYRNSACLIFSAEIRRRLAKWNLSPTREAEIVEELSQHLEEQYEDALGRGASEDEARRAALRDLELPDSLGRAMKYVEPIQMGTGRKSNMLADLGQDIHYGLRILRKNPAFTAIAVIALALGIGANSAIFSVVNAILLKPLPYKNPGSTRDDLGKGDPSGLPEGHTATRELP